MSKLYVYNNMHLKLDIENKINIPYTFKRAEYSIIPIVFNAVHLYSPPSSVRTRDIFK